MSSPIPILKYHQYAESFTQATIYAWNHPRNHGHSIPNLSVKVQVISQSKMTKIPILEILSRPQSD
ncbi:MULTISPECIES: hypothetical protein [unclassified Coleofasciculus]|uniref:hypothetical protein n=1 Tax=unclassified Coleofasciculus TaxID=2692782 RepID=UPI001882F07E|nr:MULTISPECIES: hypothetical protein [unclassified Coleofasciculus]MBE9129172.1 hypothetical protein [Coleofasciculus sp. LEGE 07081]MBE9151094.1 hypothetical protein [Coleofasciculus sp. LEGE 07092]